ncbi:hypothetical protein HBI32_172400 [Parastagonospora nodorum]|nr:hypothetical protein HBI32_172400 [Parastagonospora nodorum]
MNVREDHAAQTAAADESASTTSPPRRDPVEDANPSFTRKRPRLDSGSNSVRALSTDTESSTRTTASPPREQQVEMTIRSHPPSSPVSAPIDDGHNADAMPADSQNISPILIDSTGDDSGSPPVMLIEEDEQSALGFTVRVDAYDHFQRFPWAPAGNYTQVAHELPQYIQASMPVDPQLLIQLSEWLDDLPDPSVNVESFYTGKAEFWNEFAAIVGKVLTRRYHWMNALNNRESSDYNRYPLGDDVEDLQTDQIFDRFLGAYLRICSYILLIDAGMLSQQPAEQICQLPLLSNRHIRFLHNILRFDKTAIFQFLQKEYAMDVRDLQTRMYKDFLKASGAQNLLRLADEAFHRLAPNVQNNYALIISQLLSALGWTIFELPGTNTFIDRAHYHRGVLSFFQKYGTDLYEPSLPSDANIARDLVQHYSILVQDICQWDESIAPELMNELMDSSDPDSPMAPSGASDAGTGDIDYRKDPSCYPSLVSCAYKFKVLRKCVVKGNMNMRVMSIATMDAALVEVWRDYSALDPSCKHPVIQYLADFLLRGQIVDYIVSVDSHPQLISRSANIAGFLVIAHRWSDDQADAIWKTVSSSPDPRVVVATIAMLRGIIGLMTMSDRLYLCTKLYNLPMDRYTMDILRFFRFLTANLNENGNLIHIDKADRGPTARPWNVCIRVIRETAPSRQADKNLLDLQHEAFDHLCALTAAISPNERRIIYRECAQQIADCSDAATGNYRILCQLAQYTHPDDAIFSAQNLDLMRSVLSEIPAFVEKEAQNTSYPWQVEALQYRLDLLRLTITHPAMSVPVDLHQDLWDHIVGEKALSNESRDLAWMTLLEANKSSPGDEFCKQLVSSYIPNMDAQLYTNGLFGFVANYGFPVTRKTIPTEQGTDSLLQIPGADLLWRLILSSPAGTIEDAAARLLASRYVCVVESPGVTAAEVEKAHVALVDQCMQKLRIAFETQPEQTTNEPILHHSSEVHVRRVLLFQKLLLGFARQKPELNRRRMDSKVDAMDTSADVSYGDAITIRYQCGNDRQCVTMSSEHTVDDLYRRLCHATGLTKVNLFARGQRLKVFEEAPLKLSDIDFGGQVIVQRADGAELTRPMPDLAAGSSVFETAIVEHFDELFTWMKSGDTTSYLLFDFLSFFPTRTSFADKVTEGEVPSENLFPPGRVFQARYAALALQTRLREQIHDSALNETFLCHAVQYLHKALLDTQLIDESLSDPQQLQLAAVIVGILLEFLRERPTPKTSAAYFSHGSSLVDRLVKIVTVALDSPDSAPIAQDAYATILEASLHSRAIWETFMSHSDVHRVHQTMLLSQPHEATREYVSRKIASLCGGDLPSTCPITRAETGSKFWTIISAIIPIAARHARQSKQLFKIAEHVFRANDEYDRNEDHLRSLMTQWSTLLLSHNHDGFPGREETDYVVHGLTKLILCCILSIKSFKKPVNAGSLLKQVFKKYLFVSNIQTGSASPDQISLPILESHTRRELYDLMLGLAEDQSTYQILLQLVGEIEQEDTELMLTTSVVNRSMEIRSPTGYVGLYNPRAICYMNSLLTQLFMNLNFRQFVLNLKVNEGFGSQKLLFETQRLFAQMQNSFRKWTDPRDFAGCVKSLDKTPIDIAVQMDADEFYNLLFDQWEAQMFKQEHKSKFRAFYGGQTMNQIKSKECEHVSERVEPFFAVQCDIAGKANLQESLQAYVEGDVMEGDNKYKCESCDGKFVDAVKRTCLKDAPDNLIFHLKRFEFDLNDFSRRKIYDHFAFPETLDISPYKFDHLADPEKPREEDVFDLVGVLVHTGTCENGHYYSYIRQRPCSSESATPTWVEFNDSEVTPFDPAEIAERTFGGFTEGEGYNRQIKQFSAYMLFYQRRSAVEEDQRCWATTSANRNPQIAIPTLFEEEIDSNNEQFLREYSQYDPAHSKFVRQLHNVARTISHGVCSEDHVQEARGLSIVLSHLGLIAWRQSDSEISSELILHIRRAMISCSSCCSIALRWLAGSDSAMTNILIKCTHPTLRSQMRALLVDSLKSLREQEPSAYESDSSDSDMEVDSSTPVEGVLVALTRRLRVTADESYESTRGWEDFYLLLTQIAEMGLLETAVLLNHSFLQFCLKLFCMHTHKPSREDCPELARVMDKRRSIFNRLICFVWKLLSQMDLNLDVLNDNDTHDRLSTFDRERMKFPLSIRETAAVMYWSDDIKAIAIIDKILEVFDDSKTDHFYPGDIIKWILESRSAKLQSDMGRTIIEGIQMEPPFCDAYIQAALPLCEASAISEKITTTINTVVKMVASSKRAAEDRLPSGDAVLGLFFGLLTAENQAFFYHKHPHAFYHCLMQRSSVYGIALLCHDEDRVRKSTNIFFQKLYGTKEAMALETIAIKYKSARELLTEVTHKFVYERDVGRHRLDMVPLIDTGRLLVEQLYLLSQNEEPEAKQFQHANDAALIGLFQQEVEAGLPSWPHDIGTPMSQGDAFEQSDYGSESDDAHELLEN